MRVIVLIAAFVCAALCQEFEVVSVKPSDPNAHGSQSKSDPGRLTMRNNSLQKLIVRAYGIKDYQLKGPDWLTSQRFDIVAKFPADLPKDAEKSNAAFRAMMQKMLEERFKLTVHREQKTLPVYGVTAAKGGIKFKEATGCDGNSQYSRGRQYKGACVSMDNFAEFLSRQVDDLPNNRPVLDMTGLKGFYDVALAWFREPREAGETAAGPALPVALQEQLGLKLEPRKAPIDVLVVDHAERAPTEN